MKSSINPRYADNAVLNLSFNFSVSLIRYCVVLREKKEYELAHQLIRCGTSVGANLIEAQNAESPADFKHKVKIALKEADETEYWIRILIAILGEDKLDKLLISIQEIIKILNKILSTLSKKQGTKII